MKVVGLDLSLTSTGVAVATQDGAVTDRITSKPARKVGGGDPPLTIHERSDRLWLMRSRIAEHIPGADLIVVEAPAYDSTTGHQHERSGLWWLVVDWCRGHDYTVVEVTTGGVKRYATGKGGASKDDVLSAVIRRYPHIDVNGNDEADALILAAMGARHLGHPLERPRVPRPGQSIDAGHGLPQTHLAAMDAVTWPNPDRAA